MKVSNLFACAELVESVGWKMGLCCCVHCFPIAPAEERMDGFDCGMAFVSLFAPSLSAAPVVLSVMLDVDWGWELRPSCSERGPVDFGIEGIVDYSWVFIVIDLRVGVY